jgi:prepilin-type processing-associated H-X9-DG protein
LPVQNPLSDDLNSGVFFNQCRSDGFPQPQGSIGAKKSTLDFISNNDGSSHTLMLSENLQASTWASDPINANANFSNDFTIRQSTAFVWYYLGASHDSASNGGPISNFITTFDPQGAPINGLARSISGPATLLYPNPTPGAPGGLAYARPSSNHPGGVNVAFCDGHMRFIAEDIGYHVYTQLMTPNQNGVKLSATTTPKTQNWTYVVNEADY